MLAQGRRLSQASASGSLLNGTFWTVWERSTLLSHAVKQLTQLLVQAATEVNTVEHVHFLFSLVVVLHYETKLKGRSEKRRMFGGC